MSERYWLKADVVVRLRSKGERLNLTECCTWHEVPEDDFRMAERQAGFHAPTGGFGGNGLSGRITYNGQECRDE